VAGACDLLRLPGKFRYLVAEFGQHCSPDFSPLAEIAPGGNLAMLAQNIDTIRRSVAWDDPEGGRQEFHADIGKPFMIMGQNRLARFETPRATKRNLPARPAHHARFNTLRRAWFN